MNRMRKAGVELSGGTTFIMLGLAVAATLAGCQRQVGDPRPNALAYYTALSRQDWKTMYGLTAFSDEEKEVYKDAAEFAQKMDKQLTTDGPDKKGFDLLKGLSEIAVGAPQADGSKAVVPTSAFLTLGGKRMRFQGVARMIEQDGTWKLDTTEGGPDVPAKVIGQLLGQKTDVSSAEPAK